MTCERRSMCVGEHSTTYERLVDLIVSRALGGVERAMGIEPKRTDLQSPWNSTSREAQKAACDWRANFRVMRDNIGPQLLHLVGLPLSDPELPVTMGEGSPSRPAFP
jgi:hypothetical protein